MVKYNLLTVQKTLESTYIDSDCIRKSQRGQNVFEKSKELEKQTVFLAEDHIENKKKCSGFHCGNFCKTRTKERYF